MSTTPLYKKLGIKRGMQVLIFQAPTEYWNFFDEVPDEIEQVDRAKNHSMEFIHFFCQTQHELKEGIEFCLPLLSKTGGLWVSWPKASSKLQSEVTQHDVRSSLWATGLVDCKVAAITENWSGIKFMFPKEDRTK